MSEKILKSRVIQKHDIEANWLKATNFIPKQGEIIIYDIDSTHNYERMKIGDGKTVVSSLPFVEASKAENANHATTADTATNAGHATTAGHATSADTATTADSATKATQDASGNVITTTYETKVDAAAKLTEAKEYTDSEIDKWVGDTLVSEQISEAINALPQVVNPSVGQLLAINAIDEDGYISEFASVEASKIFIGTRLEYEAANADGKIPVGTLVIFTDDIILNGDSSEGETGSTSTSPMLGTGALCYMILG